MPRSARKSRRDIADFAQFVLPLTAVLVLVLTLELGHSAGSNAQSVLHCLVGSCHVLCYLLV
jgi:hypothetical protein